ncbi:cobalamin biosynthesis protein CobW [Ferrovibrio terrae]|uniref:Cobalamin biosynthesis protein CobW n=1 Tax=Ferrovibrio terrae TaxID=2594003 RepID=A0A516H065_9PROT|nr:cobalamin biosynthesis protein CobW [Ferrovibrio terrae]QDO97171.1 cobalamin biosynthesis protein CobW [Ferrovibrio terrae]
MQKTAAAANKIPATVVTGFLGAGKTTLIRHLITNANGRRIALIVNEFGEMGIDGDLLKSCGAPDCSEDDIIELANGCLCCTVADDFLPTLQKLLDRPEPPTHIVIETSGLALPKPLVQAFAWPGIRSRTTVDGVITVVDAAAVAEGRFADDEEALAAQRAADPSLDHDNPLEELFEDQLGCADLVLLNKADLLDEGALDNVRAEIAAHLRQGVKTLSISKGEIAADILLGLRAAAEDDIAARKSHHDTEDDHDHEDFFSFSVTLPEQASPDALLDSLLPVIADHDILRVKGFVAVAGKKMRLVLQGVGMRLSHYYDRDWHGHEPRATRLVVIGQAGLDEAAIRAALAAI